MIMTVGEWDQRQLCPDGGCVGLIGTDGTCNVCGRVAPNWGDERTRGLIAPDVEGGGDEEYEDEEEDAEAEAGDESDAPEVAAAPAIDAEWPERELCADGACIGVIGADGLCKVCGKPG